MRCLFFFMDCAVYSKQWQKYLLCAGHLAAVNVDACKTLCYVAKPTWIE